MGIPFYRPASLLHPRSFLALPSLIAAVAVSVCSLAYGRPSPQGIAAPSFYQRALDCFGRGEYERALDLLERTPADRAADPKKRADLLNLRGAICLRQARLERAGPLFAEAVALDPDLWAARFNLAETAFRQKRYDDSQRQFDALVNRTSRSRQPDEWSAAEYKRLLSALLAGQEELVAREVSRLVARENPPLYSFYLQAALRLRQGQTEGARMALRSAEDARVTGENRGYEESFQHLGWASVLSDRLAAGRRAEEAEAGKALPVLGPSASPLAVSLVRRPAARGAATLAMVQVIPAERSSARTPVGPAKASGSLPAQKPRTAIRERLPVAAQPPTPSANPVGISQSMPPAPQLAPVDEETDDIAPGLLARKRPAPKPSPAEEPSAAAPEASSSPAAAAVTPASAPTPAPAATPSPDPATPAFLQKYEAAYIRFLEKDYAGAKALLNEADAIQKNQPASIDLRNKIFSYYYKIAYAKYTDKDYAGSQIALDEADAVEKDQPDSLNLRGLIFSRQRIFDQAEVMFKKAVQADPGFWAAKFNMAELPFTYKNYTVARTRYEQLLAETDVAKQPREAELTQFKVFLTLLLEGKVDAARAFMDHFSFTGATPARYYCQAGLDFYAGETDKAAESIAEARKDFPAQIEAIFADSFYRVGWLTDPQKTSASAPVVASASAGPAASPSPAGATAAAAPSASPIIVAAASPTVAPFPSPTLAPAAVASALPSPVVTKAPAVVITPVPAAVASASPSPAVTKVPPVIITPSPAAVASASPSSPATRAPVVVITPVPAAIASASPPPATGTPAPAPLVPRGPSATTPAPPAVALAAPSPSALPRASAAPTAQASPFDAEPESSPTAAGEATAETSAKPEEPEGTTQDDIIRLFALLLVPSYLIGSWYYVWRRVAAFRADARKPALHYGGRKRLQQKAEIPR